MTEKIADKYKLQDEDGELMNAFKHTYLASLNKNILGKSMATKIANAHENKIDNLKEGNNQNTVMDLHNNALGLSINRHLFMTDAQFAEYVFNIVKEDGYWIKPEVHTPDWAE